MARPISSHRGSPLPTHGTAHLQSQGCHTHTHTHTHTHSYFTLNFTVTHTQLQTHTGEKNTLSEFLSMLYTHTNTYTQTHKIQILTRPSFSPLKVILQIHLPFPKALGDAVHSQVPESDGLI